jgi:peptidoglycan/LPS O-acetylase OafA/YrhL
VAGVSLKQGALMYASTLQDPGQLPWWNHFIDYFYFNRFECMAIGAVGAWLLFERRERALRILFNRPVQLVVYAAAVAAVLTTRGKPILQHAPHSVLFCIIIMNVAANEHSILKLRAPAWILLGDISYAMYMLHELAIVGAMRLITSASGSRFGDLPSNVALYVLGIGATMALALVAFKVYERPFLRLKNRFTVVASGAQARR